VSVSWKVETILNWRTPRREDAKTQNEVDGSRKPFIFQWFFCNSTIASAKALPIGAMIFAAPW